MSLLDFPILHTDVMREAMADWFVATDHAYGGAEGEALLEECVRVLARYGLVRPDTISPEKGALALVVGAMLHRLDDLSVYNEQGLARHLTASTDRAATIITSHLGTPTGYEDQPELLAQRLHNNIPLDRL